MTQALCNEILRLDCQALVWEAIYRTALAEISIADVQWQATAERGWTLLNLSAWVNGQW